MFVTGSWSCSACPRCSSTACPLDSRTGSRPGSRRARRPALHARDGRPSCSLCASGKLSARRRARLPRRGVRRGDLDRHGRSASAPTAAAGLVLAAGGGLLAAVEHGWRRPGRRPAPVALRRRRRPGPLCGAAMAGVFIAYGQIDAFSPFTTVSVASFAGLASCCRSAIVRRRGAPRPSDRAAGVLGVSVLDMLAFLAGSAALALGPVSVASVLQAQTATVSTVLGLAVLHETAGLVAGGRRRRDDRRRQPARLGDVTSPTGRAATSIPTGISRRR